MAWELSGDWVSGDKAECNTSNGDKGETRGQQGSGSIRLLMVMKVKQGGNGD